MNTPTLVLNEVRERGFAALQRELGSAGLVQFIQQFRKGRGDYSRDRHKWLDKWTVADIHAAIKDQRRKKRQ